MSFLAVRLFIIKDVWYKSFQYGVHKSLNQSLGSRPTSSLAKSRIQIWSQWFTQFLAESGFKLLHEMGVARIFKLRLLNKFLTFSSPTILLCLRRLLQKHSSYFLLATVARTHRLRERRKASVVVAVIQPYAFFFWGFFFSKELDHSSGWRSLKSQWRLWR